MPNKYGFSELQWENGKREMLGILRQRASQGRTIAYGELSSKLTSIQIGPHDYAIGVMLGEISTDEDARGRGMLSVIVVHKEGDQQPGKGFFDCAVSLGRCVNDRDRMWIDELNRVYAESAKANLNTTEI
jgi:hypothetical protein